MSETTVTILNHENRKVVYTQTVHYCPHCGQQQVWEEDGAGDFYLGVGYVCISCQWTFCLPILSDDGAFVAALIQGLAP